MRKRDKAGFRIFFAYLEETGLDEPLRAICRSHAVTLAEIYLDTKGPTVYAARLECWGWLTLAAGKSSAEVGRLFDRDPTSVLYALRRLAEGASLTLAGLHKAALATSTRAAAGFAANGRRLAAGRATAAPGTRLEGEATQSQPEASKDVLRASGEE